MESIRNMLSYDHWTEVPSSVWSMVYFHPEEIACKGTGSIVINEEALEALDNFRAFIGGPVSVSSAFRSTYHNAVIGGAPMSSHTVRGSNGPSAFDIKLDGRDKSVIKHCAKEVGFTGFGMKYNTFVHIDLGKRREW
jgi:uncharacterized protein YcbK (DUF882 family)|tara:strand:+ start:204 stop:614 length:411 start_codon:yes stop_codon:yes gene_type:complete